MCIRNEENSHSSVMVQAACALQLKVYGMADFSSACVIRRIVYFVWVAVLPVFCQPVLVVLSRLFAKVQRKRVPVGLSHLVPTEKHGRKLFAVSLLDLVQEYYPQFI